MKINFRRKDKIVYEIKKENFQLHSQLEKLCRNKSIIDRVIEIQCKMKKNKRMTI